MGILFFRIFAKFGVKNDFILIHVIYPALTTFEIIDKFDEFFTTNYYPIS